MSPLFTPFKIKQIEFKNRIFVSPMCQYSSDDGVANDWHLVHLGSRAVGGAALVLTEATAVSPEGRISPQDLGLWNEEQMNALSRITRFIKAQGAVAGIQLAHAGRKASTNSPWMSQKGRVASVDQGGWIPIGPSSTAFDESSPLPIEMTKSHMQKTLNDFVSAAERSFRAGFEVLEIHMAHGYLLNEFLSPLANERTDEFGGPIENRMRFPLQVTKAIRAVWPATLPLFVRISASDWVKGGWTLEDSLILAAELKKLGVDLIDCSSGGNSPAAQIPVNPGYQVEFSHKIREEIQIATGAVGLITDAELAEKIIRENQADFVLLAREMLRDPYWPLHAAHQLNTKIPWPKQYERARFKPAR